MQEIIPITINKAARAVVINNPNAFHAGFIRKVFNRPEPTVMGYPTLGGLGVVSADDDTDCDFIPLGNAYAYQVGFQPATMMDRMDAQNGVDNEFIFLIEPEFLLPDSRGFEIKKNDIFRLTIMVVAGAVSYQAFEVTRVETTTNIPPFTRRYVCERRSEYDA